MNKVKKVKTVADIQEGLALSSLNYYAVKARLNPDNKNMEEVSVNYSKAEDGLGRCKGCGDPIRSDEDLLCGRCI